MQPSFVLTRFSHCSWPDHAVRHIRVTRRAREHALVRDFEHRAPVDRGIDLRCLMGVCRDGGSEIDRALAGPGANSLRIRETIAAHPEQRTRAMRRGRQIGQHIRPSSSVTTILANSVGRSLVSAITQTPASGPLAPVTTPPIALAPTWMAASVAATCADAGRPARSSTSANGIAPRALFILGIVYLPHLANHRGRASKANPQRQ